MGSALDTLSSPFALVLPELVQAVPERGLVVEDDVDLQEVFRRVVASIEPSIRLDWAVSFGQAVQMLQNNHYDFAVVDYLLVDGSSGLALRRWCKVHRPFLPFAMISAVPIATEIRRNAEPPCAFLPKPFSPRELKQFLLRVRRTH